MTVEKPKPKQLLRPITTGAGSAMNQSQFLAITCNSLEARERSRVHGAIDFGFASHWLKNWRESFNPITKRSNRNHGITFDSHLKTALLRPITTGADSAMNQSQFLAITCNSLEAREKSRVHGVIGFGFDSHWLKNWPKSFKPITKRSNRNHVITFDSYLKTAVLKFYFCVVRL